MRQASLAVFFCIFLTSNLGAQEQPIYLTGGHLVDVVRDEIYEDIGIVCEGGKITGLFFDFLYNENFIPPDAVRVDVSGKYLLPGLIDLHAHAGTEFRGIEVDLERFFRLFLKGGVTTIRAMSNDMAALIRDKAAVDAGTMDGPNIIVGSNSFEQVAGFPKLPRTNIVHNPTEARELVSNYAYEGADWMKFYNYGDAEIVRAVVDEADTHGRKVFGHFATLGAADAACLGVDSLEHTVALLQKALDYEDSISMTDIGYYRLFVLWPSVNEEKLDEIVEVLIEHDTAVVPTLTIQNVVADPEGIARRSADWFPYYQPEIYQSFRADPKRVPDAYDFSNVRGQWPESIRVQARLMAKFLHMGGMVGTGSDLNAAPPIVPGLSIHQEMQYFVDGGMTPLEALRTATIMAVEILGWETRFGSIEVGKEADIVAIDGNPLVDITNISNIDTVVKAGKVYRISELEDMLRNDRQ